MRIRHVIRGRCNPDNADGIIRHTYYLAHAQLRLGHDVAVYGLESGAEEPEVIDRNGLKVFAFPRTVGPFAVHPELRRLIAEKSDDIDLVHIQPPHDPAMFGLSRLLTSQAIPYFLSAHAMWDPQALARHRFRKRVYKILFDNRMCRAALGVHATSATEVDSIRAYAPSTPVYTVRNSIDLSLFDEVEPRSGFWQERFGVPDRSKLFAFVGRLDPHQKGLDILLDAWSRVTHETHAQLALIGPFWRDSERTVQTLVDTHAIRGSVILTGPLFGHEKVWALRGADCYIQVSRYESSPYSIQEAFACGIPAILTAATNLADVAERYGAGWKVAPEPVAIAKTIKRICSMTSDEITSAGLAARLLVEERHSLDRAAARLVEAYRAALSGSQFEDDD